MCILTTYLIGKGLTFEDTNRENINPCLFYYLTDTIPGDHRCYFTYNSRGDLLGNCGYNQTHFLPCELMLVDLMVYSVFLMKTSFHRNVNCGMLFCDNNGGYQNTVPFPVAVVNVDVTENVGCL